MHGRWVLDPQGSHPISAFGASHVWGLDHIARMLSGQDPLGLVTDRLGYPRGGPAPTLGWGPALVALPLRPLLGPLGAYAGALLAAPALAGAFAWWWLRQAVRATPWAATAGALLFALSPGMLNNLALGNIDKLAAWVFPAWLVLAGLVVQGRRPLLALIGAVVVAFLAPMSEPYLGLFLPLVGVPVVGLLVLEQPAGQRLVGALRAGLVLGLTAAAMLPARTYYAVYGAGIEGAQVFRPASVTTIDGGDGWTRPWATLADLVATPVAVPPDPERAFHVFYVGLVGLVGAVVLALLPGVRGRRYGLAVLLVGLVLVLGPYTVLPETWGLPGPQRYLLPVHLLESLGYPTRLGGQYYRALPLVGLGIGALLAAGLSARRGPLGPVLGLGLAVGGVADAIACTPGAWPRPLREVPCRSVLSAVRESGGPGGLFNVRLQASQARNGEALMLATLHRLPVNTLPLATFAPGIDSAYGWLSPLGAMSDTGRAVTWLHDQGYRYLLLTPLGSSSLQVLTADRLEATLGPPTWADEECAAWDLGPPTRLKEPREPR